MKYLKGVLAVSLAVSVFNGQSRAAEFELYTFPAAPYQVVDETSGPAPVVRGLTVDTVICAAAGAGGLARFHAAPQRRALQFLLSDQVDGYFAVDPSTALDEIALRTDPVSLEKWHLVSRPEPAPPENPRIGAVSGSNEEAWLRARGKEIFVTVRSSQQLIALLQRKRIDQALMDQRVLESLSDTEGLTSQFLRYVPLHMYLSKRFESRNPGFIAAFNRRIPDCINGSFGLDEVETAHIRGLAYDLFKEIEASVPLRAAIDEGPRIANLSEILNLDAQWQALAPLHYSPMARRVADTAASVALSNWQDTRGSLITEVMVTNNIGSLVAMSRLTSDFWHGDEPKFQRHIREDTRDLYVSPIRYDASTSRFQVTVSLPIHIKGRWIPVGVLVIGLDVEEALVGENHILYLTQNTPR